jgi:hypothetical protein
MIGAKRCIKSFGSTPHLVSYEVCLCLCCEIGHIAKPKSFPLLLARITIPRDAIHEELYVTGLLRHAFTLQPIQE